MLETTGNLWTTPADWRVITTNGDVKTNGACVMGRGCALEACERFPGIDHVLGRMIQGLGNHVHVLKEGILSFPVKHHWRDRADIELIRRSATELRDFCDGRGTGIDYRGPFYRILLPRPGCGNGGLNWTDVKPILESILDDRFAVITFPERRPPWPIASKNTDPVSGPSTTNRIY